MGILFPMGWEEKVSVRLQGDGERNGAGKFPITASNH